MDDESNVSVLQAALNTTDAVTIADLRATNNPTGSNIARLVRTYALNGGKMRSDGGGGIFVWTVFPSEAVAPADDDLTIIKPPAQNKGGRWVRLHTLGTIAILKTISPPNGGKPSYEVLGFTTPGDGGGGMFIWDGTSTGPDNEGTIIVPAANPTTGRWKRVFSGSVDIRWFGAKSRDPSNFQQSDNDTAAIQAAVSAADSIFFPPGHYVVRRVDPVLNIAVVVGSNKRLFGAGPSSVIHNLGMSVSDRTKDYIAFDLPDGTTDVVFETLRFAGEHVPVSPESAGLDGSAASVIRLRRPCAATADVAVRDCVFENQFGFSLHSEGPARRLMFSRNTCRHVANGLNPNTQNTQICDNSFFKCGALEGLDRDSVVANNLFINSLYGCAVSLGGNQSGGYTIPGIIFSNNVIACVEGTPSSERPTLGLVVSSSIVRAIISGNRISDTKEHGLVVSGSPNLAEAVTIDGNTIENVGYHGIYITGSKHVISNNRITGSFICGINSAACVDLTIRGNVISGGNLDLGFEQGGSTNVRLYGNSYATIGGGSYSQTTFAPERNGAGLVVSVDGQPGPTILTGTTAPSAVAPEGSIYLQSGASGRLWVMQVGVWTQK